ncbi:MAG: hypothetical protein CH6_2589 [Candidatus Kapaibacterium sp.]|nr:MAG: hypothetical protein CH6_2589 [Candidatus Kapabacteria bacterium]
MKKKVIFLIIIYLAITPFALDCKPKKRKIETYEITHTYTKWWYCFDGYKYDENCIERMSLTFENGSQFQTSGLSFWVEIRDFDDNVLYRRKHTASLQLDPGEVGSTEEFYLYEKVWWYDPNKIYITIESVW